MADKDPYRGTGTGPCPRCGRALDLAGPHHFHCTTGCGEFYGYEAIGGRSNMAAAGHDTAVGWPWGQAACPTCGKQMGVRIREELRFDACESHGVWLDAGEHDRFMEIVRGPT